MLENDLPDGGLRFIPPEDETEIDQDLYQEWAEDKCYAEICENLYETILQESSIVEDFILDYQDPKTINWEKLSTHLRKTTLYDLVEALTQYKIRDSEDELIEEYIESLKE